MKYIPSLRMVATPEERKNLEKVSAYLIDMLAEIESSMTDAVDENSPITFSADGESVVFSDFQLSHFRDFLWILAAEDGCNMTYKQNE